MFLGAAAGMWFPNSVARTLPNPLLFATVWVVGLQERTDDGEYIYIVAHLDVSNGDAPAFRVRITKDFDAWYVKDVREGTTDR